MEFVDLKEKSVKELNELLANQQNEVRELRFKITSGQLKQPEKLRAAKKTIARVRTVLNSPKK